MQVHASFYTPLDNTNKCTSILRYHRSLELNVQSRVTLDPFIPTLEGIVCTISTNEIDKIN
jgi:hypothetical protein